MIFQENHFRFPCHLKRKFSYSAAIGVRKTWLIMALLLTTSFSSFLRANLIKSDMKLLKTVKDAMEIERAVIITFPSQDQYDFMKLSNSSVDKWLVSNAKDPIYLWTR